jgi:predicted RNase H-like HicB family nuclease
MEYTIFLSRQPNKPWRAVVHELPDCVVESPTRSEALEKIRERIKTVVHHLEVLRLEVEAVPQVNDQSLPLTQTPWHWFGTSADEPTHTAVYDAIEQQRDTHFVVE